MSNDARWAKDSWSTHLPLGRPRAGLGHTRERSTQLRQRLSNESADDDIDEKRHGSHHGQKEHHVADDGITHVGHGAIGGNHHRYCSGHISHTPALFRVTSRIQLAGGLAVALDAVVGDVHGPHIAEDLITSLGLVAPDLIGVLIRQKCLDGGGLVGVRDIVNVARVQIREADGVVRLLGEQSRHRLARDGAVQSLVVVLPIGGVVDDVLIQGDEIPHGIHLGNEHPRLFQKVGLGAARLIVVGEGKEHR